MYQGLKSNDLVTKYLSLTAINAIVRLPSLEDVNYGEMVPAVMPAVHEIATKLTQSNLIYRVLSVIPNIITKAAAHGQLSPVILFEGLDIERLVHLGKHLVVSALILTFKNLIGCQPFGTPNLSVFEASMKFLTLALPKANVEDSQELAFWQFLIKELCPTPENAHLVDQHFLLLHNSSFVSSHTTDELQLEFVMDIIIESLLIDHTRLKIE